MPLTPDIAGPINAGNSVDQLDFAGLPIDEQYDTLNDDDFANGREVGLYWQNMLLKNTCGAVPVRNETGVTLDKGALLTILGWSAAHSRFLVGKAQADDKTKEAKLVLSASLTTATNGIAIGRGVVTEINTNAVAAAGDKIFLSDTPGAFSAAAGTYRKVVGVVLVKHASAGSARFYPTDTGWESDGAPAAHAASHKTGGGDEIKLHELGAPTGSVSLNSQKITNLATPSAASDAATKAYVDALINGFDVKESVRAATTANITLSGEQTIDGVACVAGDRVLAKNQSTGAQNGIYVVSAGAWSRSADADADAEVTAGLWVRVEEGSVNADTGYLLTTNNPITVGSTALTFTQFPTTGGGAHASTHQDGGGDEISVAGLSGELADPQPAKVSGLTALADLAYDDQGLVYDASAATNRKMPLVPKLGLRNLLRNGNFRFWRGENTSDAHDNYVLPDCWRLVDEASGGGGAFITHISSGLPTDRQKHAFNFQSDGTYSNKVGLFQWLAGRNCWHLRGRTVTLSFWLYISSVSQLADFRAGIVEFTGTEDSLTTDPVTTWGTAGANPTLATNHAFVNTPANLASGMSDGVWAKLSVQATLGTSFKNLGVMLWVDDRSWNATWAVTDVQLEEGCASEFENRPDEIEALLTSPEVLDIFFPADGEQPATNPASFDTRNEQAVLGFDTTTQEIIYFTGVMNPKYKGSKSAGIRAYLICAAASATTGTIGWDVAFERQNADHPNGSSGGGQDIDSSSFASAKTVTAKTVPGTAGIPMLQFVDVAHSEIDSLLSGRFERYRLRVRRDVANDNAAGNADLLAVILVNRLIENESVSQ